MTAAPSASGSSDEPKGNGSSSRKPLLWGLGGLLLGGLATAALIVGQLTTIANGLQAIFPQIGPFDAAITLSGVVAKSQPVVVQRKFEGDSTVPAVSLVIEFVETTTGRSKVSGCFSELLVGQKSYRSNSDPVDRPADSQNVVEETFHLPQAQYGGQAALRRRCVRRIAPAVAVDLPPLPAPAKPPERTSYVVCIGERREACGGTATWLPCYSSASQWAKTSYPAQCTSVSERLLSDVRGNKCGYATFEVTCTR